MVTFPPRLTLDVNGRVLYNQDCRVKALDPGTSDTVTVAGFATYGGDNPFGPIRAIATGRTGDLYLLDDSIWKIDAVTKLASQNDRHCGIVASVQQFRTMRTWP